MCKICGGSGWTETGPCPDCDGRGEPMDAETCSDNCADKVPVGGYYLCRVFGAEWLPDEDT